MTFERLGGLLDDDARTHEPVKRNARERSHRVRHRRRVLALDELDELGRKAIPGARSAPCAKRDGRAARTQTERAHPSVHQHRSSQNDPDRNAERGFASPTRERGRAPSLIVHRVDRGAYLDVPPNPRKLERA